MWKVSKNLIKHMLDLTTRFLQARSKGRLDLIRRAWEDSFFLDPLDHDYPLGLRNSLRTLQGARPRQEKKK